MLGVGYLLLELLLGDVLEISSTAQTIDIALVSHKNLWIGPTAEDTTHFGHRT